MVKFGEVPCSSVDYLDIEEQEDFDDYYQYFEEGEEDFVDCFQSYEENLDFFQYLRGVEEEDFKSEYYKGSNFEEEEYVEDFNYQHFEDFEEEEEEEVKNEIWSTWMNDYCNLHKILLVGEGDFSFSASLALAFGSATNIVATSLDTIGYLMRNYGSAMFNIQELTSRGCNVVHGVDATNMANHLSLMGMKFDRVVFNFPHAGCFQNFPRETQLWHHRNLVGQFLENAKMMINPQGEIHVRHKSNGFFREWNLEHLGSIRGLQLLEEVHFNFIDYPGYRTKYGFGGDKNFNCNPSKTYKFGLP